MTSLFGIYGVGGCGRGVMPVAREQLGGRADARLVFVDDRATEKEINGHDVVSLEECLETPADTRSIAIAIASSKARQDVAQRCRGAGVPSFEVRAANVIQMDDVEIGEGA